MKHHCERCDELQEEVRQLRNAIIGIDEIEINRNEPLRAKFKLTGNQLRIFMMLYTRLNQWVSTKRLEHANEPTKADYIDRANNLKVQLSRIRRKVATDYHIVNRFGEAYKLEPINHDAPSIPAVSRSSQTTGRESASRVDHAATSTLNPAK